MATVDNALVEEWAFLQRLSKDLKQAARLLGRRQVRYLVDAYYQIQHYRIAMAAQVRASGEDTEPHVLLQWLFSQMEGMENNIKRALDEFSSEYRVGLWCKAVTGIGPVIASGLMARLEMEPWKCTRSKGPRDHCTAREPHEPPCGRIKIITVGHFWRFCGLDPTLSWEKGQKRPWNAELKTLTAFKLGESFVKFQNNKNDHYGQLYRIRKDKELQRNDQGLFKEQAAAMLAKKKFSKDTEAFKHYSEGRLPPAHVHARARRYAVKIFLSHLHHVMHRDWFGAAPPVPYAFEKLPDQDHRHYIELPFPLGEEGRSLRDMGE